MKYSAFKTHIRLISRIVFIKLFIHPLKHKQSGGNHVSSVSYFHFSIKEIGFERLFSELQCLQRDGNHKFTCQAQPATLV